MNAFLLVFLSFAISTVAFSQKSILLYSDSIPNSTGYKIVEEPVKYGEMIIGVKNVYEPSLSVYLPSPGAANGSAVIICTGGGYGIVAMPEGTRIAETFIKYGVAAFVLKYRLPSDSIMHDKSIGPLQDAQQAIKLVRQNAKDWTIDQNKIGIMGLSAGGHLAACAATHFNEVYILNKEGVNLRPDFEILVYPVISFTEELMHKASRDLLLGTKPTKEQIQLFSNEQQVTAQTPPTWITHAGDDRSVPVGNSIRFYEALIRNNVAAEMHLYPKGGHGFVLLQPTEQWMQPLFGWMRSNGWLK